MEDTTFTRGPARRPMPRVADPLLQWSTGLQTKDRRIYADWLAVVGRADALDDAMAQAGFSQVTIRHGSGNMVTHWAVETANMFVIAEGIQSSYEMKNTPDRYGIAFGWRTIEGGRQQSVLRFRVYLQELLQIGFYEPLLVTVKSTLTGDLITALMRQYEVLDAVDALRAAQGKPPLQPPYYACSLPIGPGQEVARGSVQTREITPMIAQVPTPITREYISSHWVKRDWVTLIESQLDQTITWSIANSKQIAVGEEQTGGAQPEDEPIAAIPAPQANGARPQRENVL